MVDVRSPVLLEPRKMPNPNATIPELLGELTNALSAVTEFLDGTSAWLGLLGVPDRYLDPIRRAHVLRITPKIKTSLGPNTTYKTTTLHIGNFHQDLSQLKINQLSSEKKLPSFLCDMFIVTQVYKNGLRTIHIIKKHAELNDVIRQLVAAVIKIDLAEFSYLKGLLEYYEDKMMDDGHWGDDFWDNPDKYGLYYDKMNDPVVIDKFLKRALPIAKTLQPAQPLVIMDIGAGKGRLAGKLMAAALEKNITIQYIFVEPNARLMDIARAHLQDMMKDKKCQITFLQKTFENIKPAYKAHCIISSGGPLNMQVATRVAAVANLKKISGHLHDNGVLIATGQTVVIVKSKHFLGAGLTVLSFGAPCVIPEELNEHKFLNYVKNNGSFFNNSQCYVARKEEVSAASVAQQSTSKY